MILNRQLPIELIERIRIGEVGSICIKVGERMSQKPCMEGIFTSPNLNRRKRFLPSITHIIMDVYQERSAIYVEEYCMKRTKGMKSNILVGTFSEIQAMICLSWSVLDDLPSAQRFGRA